MWLNRCSMAYFGSAQQCAHLHKHAPAGAWPSSAARCSHRSTLDSTIGKLSVLWALFQLFFVHYGFHLRAGRDLRFCVIKPRSVGHSVGD